MGVMPQQFLSMDPISLTLPQIASITFASAVIYGFGANSSIRDSTSCWSGPLMTFRVACLSS